MLPNTNRKRGHFKFCAFTVVIKHIASILHNNTIPQNLIQNGKQKQKTFANKTENKHIGYTLF